MISKRPFVDKNRVFNGKRKLNVEIGGMDFEVRTMKH